MTLHLPKNISMASFALAMLFSASANAQSTDMNVVADLVSQVQELQDEVRVLRGQVEDQANELETLRQRQRDQFLDLDARISGAGGSASAASGQTGLPNAEGGGTAVENDDAALAADASQESETGADGPAVRPPMDVPSDTVALAEPEMQSQALPPNPAEEKAEYDHAFQSLKDLRYADAAENFQTFLARYPQSEYAGNAQHWLGESYYVTRNYDIALDSFEDLLKNYPESSKVPDALLKIGYAHYELKEWDKARAALEQVKEQYPDTTLARLADNRLRSMRMEGHY